MNPLPRLLALVLLAGPITLLAQTAAPNPTPPALGPEKLGSTIYPWDQLPPKNTPVGYIRTVADSRTATFQEFEFHITTLNPGKFSHPPHQHPQEELLIVKDGQCEVYINGKHEKAGPGAVIFYASNDWHNLTNVGDTTATYYVINFYTAATRTAPTKIAAESASPDKLKSGVFSWDSMVAKPTPTGMRRDVFNAPTVTYKNIESHVTTLNPGASVPAHRHGHEYLVIVRDGAVDVTINRVTQKVGAGSIVFIASNDESMMKNSGATPATYLVLAVTTEATPAETE